MKNTIKKYLSTGMLICSLLWAGSCSDNEPITPNESEKTPDIGYELIIPVTSKEETLFLPGYHSPLTVALEDQTWLSFEENEAVSDEDAVSVVFRLKNTVDNTPRRQTVKITDVDGNKCQVAISMALLAVSDANGEDDAFLTDWENQKKVNIFTNQATISVTTPWNESTVIGTLPREIRQDVKKEDGWEMVFSTLNKSTLDGANYFALYNKHSGVLRVFYYVVDATTTASEFCLEVDMGSKRNSNKFPFYHALNFSIPSNHMSLNNSMDLMGLANVANTFKTFVTAHTTSSSTALSKGWTAFDIDASAYCPANSAWRKNGDELTFAFKSTQKSLISLCGELTADITGNFSQKQEATASTSSGVGKTMKQIGEYGAKASKPIGFLTKLIWGKDISSEVNTIAGIVNFTGSLADYFSNEVYEEKYVDDMTGKAELSLSGKLDLSGQISTVASNSCPPLIISNNSFQESHFGEGIWNLAADPVVYLVSDVVIGDPKNLALVAKGDGKFQLAKDAAESINLRMVTFLDPTSIALTLNNNLLQNIDEVEVLGANIGVYPDDTPGFTSSYRSLLNLPVPTLPISSQSTGVWRGLAWNKAKDCGYMQIPCSSLIASSLGESTSNCRVYRQAGADYKYYGRVDNSMGKAYIVDPQIMLPISTTSDGAYLSAGIVPDLVVTVTIRFKANNRYYVFSRRFIPKIQKVSIKNGDLAKVYERLENYNNKCKNNQSINSVNGQPVKHRTGQASVQRPLMTLKKLLGK